MEELRTTTNIVKYLLETNPQTRNSDSYLYLKVLDVIGKDKGISIDNITVPSFLLSMGNLGFPGFETVRRTRQKIQQHHPDLAACDAVKENRHKNEEKFRVYARGVLQ